MQKRPLVVKIAFLLLIIISFSSFSLAQVKNIQKLSDEAYKFIKNGEYDEAISKCDEALKENSNYAVAYWMRAEAYLKKGKFDKAISDYNQTIELNFIKSNVYHGRGIAHLELGNYDEAIKDLTQAIYLDRRLGRDSYPYRAKAYYYKQEFDKAWADVERAKSLRVEVDPQFIKDLEEAKVKEETGQLDDEETDITQSEDFEVTDTMVEELADIIYLNNGFKVMGIIKEEDDDKVVVRLKIGTLTYSRDKISSIKYSTPQKKEELENLWNSKKR